MSFNPSNHTLWLTALPLLTRNRETKAHTLLQRYVQGIHRFCGSCQSCQEVSLKGATEPALNDQKKLTRKRNGTQIFQPKETAPQAKSA